MFAQVTAETVMSMSAPNPERFDVRVLETEANGLLPATAPAVSSLLASGVSWFAVEDEEEDDEDWDDEDEDDDDDDEEWDDEDEDDDEDELGWDDEDEDEDDDEEEE